MIIPSHIARCIILCIDYVILWGTNDVTVLSNPSVIVREGEAQVSPVVHD